MINVRLAILLINCIDASGFLKEGYSNFACTFFLVEREISI